MVDLAALLQGIVVVVQHLQPFPEVVDLHLQQLDVLRLKKVLIDCWQFLEADAVRLEGDDLVDLAVQVL